MDNGIYTDVGSTDYDPGEYVVQYDITATDDQGVVLDQSETSVGVSIDLNTFNNLP